MVLGAKLVALDLKRKTELVLSIIGRGKCFYAIDQELHTYCIKNYLMSIHTVILSSFAR